MLMDNGQPLKDPVATGITAETNSQLQKDLDSDAFTPETLNNPGALGNAALNSAAAPNIENVPTAPMSQPDQLGQVIELSMPPQSRESTDNEAHEGGQSANSNTSDEHQIIADVKKKEEKLAQDGKIDDFYEYWQHIRKDANEKSEKGDSK